MNRLLKGHDGKVGYERVRGKKSGIYGIEFGEKVFFKLPKPKGKLENINPRWKYGVFVGVRRRSNEFFVMTV